MKRIFTILLALAALCACSQEKKVMARYVPERSDDFVFENNLIAGRFYGKALEGNPTSPGLDIWVKLPGKLVADEWYKGYETQSDEYYHHDHGGKTATRWRFPWAAAHPPRSSTGDSVTRPRITDPGTSWRTAGRRPCSHFITRSGKPPKG